MDTTFQGICKLESTMVHTCRESNGRLLVDRTEYGCISWPKKTWPPWSMSDDRGAVVFLCQTGRFLESAGLMDE